MANITLVAVNAGMNTISSYRLGTHETIVWRGENYPDFVVEGCIFEVEVAKDWIFGRTHFVSGIILNQRIDIPALGLLPLPVHRSLTTRSDYEMEQVIPGSNPEDDSDLIIEAVEYKNRGDYTRAWDVLVYILKQDLRCIDAHVHMGNFDFGEGLWEFSNKRALKHYTVGVELGNYFLGSSFKGKLPWSMIDNRPYLRALHGQCLCYWALNRFEEAIKVAEYILKLNPMDNQGARFLIPELKAKVPYIESRTRGRGR